MAAAASVAGQLLEDTQDMRDREEVALTATFPAGTRAAVGGDQASWDWEAERDEGDAKPGPDAAPYRTELSETELDVLRDIQEMQDMQDSEDLDGAEGFMVRSPPRHNVAADEALITSPLMTSPLGRRSRRRLFEVVAASAVIMTAIVALAIRAYRLHLGMKSPYIGPRTAAFALLCCPMVLLFPIDDRRDSVEADKFA